MLESKEFRDSIERYAYFMSEHILMCTKNVLTAEEAACYIGVSREVLRAMTKKYDIPHYMPEKGKYYYERVELERWLMSNKVGGQSI